MKNINQSTKNYKRSSQKVYFFSASQLFKMAAKQTHVFSENVNETSGKKSGYGGTSKIAILELHLKMLRV